MRKLFFMLIIVSVAFTSCKKDKPPRKLKKIPTDFHAEYFNNGSRFLRTESHFEYDENNNLTTYDKDYLYETGVRHHYKQEYFYADPEKGLLERVEKYRDGILYARGLFTYRNDTLIRIEDWNPAGDSIMVSHDFTYDANGKVSRIRYVNITRGKDETDILTFNGDDLARIQRYNTSDMQNMIREYQYDEYDDHPLVNIHINTKQWPLLRKHNFTHKVRIDYPTNRTREYFSELEYDDDGYPVTIIEKDSNGQILFRNRIEYKKAE